MHEPLPPGSHLSKYEILRVIGEGGMGLVYEGYHPSLRKRVAIKTLRTSLASHPDVRARFLREGQAAARIRHPHVVDVTDLGEHQGMPFLVMEYLDGENLHAMLMRTGPLPLERLLDLMLPVLAAVGEGHEVGVVHRDLKPRNVFLARGRRGEIIPKVLDFGISKLIGDGSLNPTRSAMGTVAYMAPEQAAGEDADPRSDQYALGLILYEGVTGRRAYPGPEDPGLLPQIIAGRVEPPRRFRPDLPAPFEAMLLRALRRAPGERYPSVHALGGALLPFASERARAVWTDTFAPHDLGPRSGAHTVGRRPSAWRALWIGLVVGALAGAAAARLWSAGAPWGIAP